MERADMTREGMLGWKGSPSPLPQKEIMIDRASSVGILAHRVMVVGMLALVGGATACVTAPRREDDPNRYAFECPVGSRVVRVTNSGIRPVDVYLSSPLASGGGTSEFLGSVSPD